jgi:DNA-directed RNA polymerase subunit RPC12/RpoP
MDLPIQIKADKYDELMTPKPIRNLITYRYSEDDEMASFECPTCNKIIHETYSGWGYALTYKHCPYCAQRIIQIGSGTRKY